MPRGASARPIRPRYERFLQGQIARGDRAPGDVGLDVLVHGEPERNDMVEYFGEQLDGFAFTPSAGCSPTAVAA